VRRLFASVLLLLFVAGCSEPPQKEIDQAQTALDLAKTAGADKYAITEYTDAASALQKARAAVDQRDYRQALNYAIESRQRSQAAIRQAADGKTRAQRAAEAIVIDISTRASTLQTRVKAAEAARAPAKDLRSAREAMAAAQARLQEARTLIGAGNYEEATKTLTEVRGNLDAAISQVEKIPLRPARKKR
jgi:hypothetical protein